MAEASGDGQGNVCVCVLAEGYPDWAAADLPIARDWQADHRLPDMLQWLLNDQDQAGMRLYIKGA